MKKSTYGNGNSIAYQYDDIGRTTGITYDGGTTPDIEYQYDNNGNLGILTDNLSDRETKYLYDHSDRLMRTEIKGINNNEYSYIVEPSYDDINNLTGVTEIVDGTEYITSYTYDDDNRVTGTTSGRSSAELTYDEFSRLSSLQRKHNSANVVGYEYDYWTSGDKTSTQLDTLRIKTGANSGTYKVLDYTYDAKGNITSTTDGNYVTTYYYDDLNQLVRVDDPIWGSIWTYSYDLGGNILNKSEYVYSIDGPTDDNLIESIDYTYSASGWGDMLLSIDGYMVDKTFTSDAIGNMLSDGTWNYTWQHGRQLASMTNGSTTVSFGYDASGMRTSKTVGNKTWEYTYNGSTLSYMTDDTNELFFSYDSAGPLSVTYNGTEYYYVLNAQGDVIAITNSSGTVVVTYAYDPWGDLLYMTGSMKDTLGQINPLTYRGYVYDHETGLYYLQSRYYNPELCRFISADSRLNSSSILGYNMFVYCENNPVNHKDPDGHSLKKIWEGIKTKWENVKKTAKKVGKTAGKVIKSVFDSIESNVGIGMGIGAKMSGSIGVGSANLDISASNIVFYGVDDGQLGGGNRVSAGANLTILDYVSFGPSYEKQHFFSDPNCTCEVFGSNVTPYVEMAVCPASQSSSSNDIVIGVSGGAYFILGGEISLGVNVTELIENVIKIFTDEEG